MSVLAGSVALAALAVVVGSLVYLHLVPTGLSAVHDAVSHYGITRYAAGYRVATIAFGVSGLTLALAIHWAPGARGSGAVIALLLVFAAARMAISWFPMDAPGAARTETGRRHGLLAMAAFAGVAAAAFALGRSFSATAAWQRWAGVSTGLGATMVACLLGLAMARSSPGLRARFGLVERGFYLAAVAWFAVVGTAIVTR